MKDRYCESTGTLMQENLAFIITMHSITSFFLLLCLHCSDDHTGVLGHSTKNCEGAVILVHQEHGNGNLCNASLTATRFFSTVLQ